MNKKLDILKKPSPSNTPHGKLATMFRIILRDLSYVNRVPSLIARHTKMAKATASQVRTTDSIMKELTGDTMTFNVFIKLLHTLLLVKKVKITIILTHFNGDETSHEMEINLEDNIEDK